MAYADKTFYIPLDNGKSIEIEISVEASKHYIDDGNEVLDEVWEVETYVYQINGDVELTADEERELEEKIETIFKEFDWDFDEG